jgi:predicted  nucleic acid-binding Zn-ribbon protein
LFVLQEIDSQIDQLREELGMASLLADQSNVHLQPEIAQARRDEAATRAQLALREQQRRETTAFIPDPWLKHYDRLRQRLKTRPWVMRLEDACCPACNLALPSKLLADAERTGQPAACPFCARVLLYRKPEKNQ